MLADLVKYLSTRSEPATSKGKTMILHQVYKSRNVFSLFLKVIFCCYPEVKNSNDKMIILQLDLRWPKKEVTPPRILS